MGKAGAYLSEAPRKHFKPSLMFVGKERSPPYGGVPERCFTRVGSGVIRKH